MKYLELKLSKKYLHFNAEFLPPSCIKLIQFTQNIYILCICTKVAQVLNYTEEGES